LSPLFRVVEKSFDEGSDSKTFKVTLESPNGHVLILSVNGSDFERYMVGDSIMVEIGSYEDLWTPDLRWSQRRPENPRPDIRAPLWIP